MSPDDPTRAGPPPPLWMQRIHSGEPVSGRTEEEKEQRRRRLARYYERRRGELQVEDDLTVFAAYWFSAVSCNPRAIYDKLGELVPDMRRVWVVAKRSAPWVPDGVPYVIARTKEYFDVLARGRYFVNNVNFPDHYVKRDGQIHVQTHHGTPLKRMGLDQEHLPDTRPEEDVDLLLARCARWDYSISSNAHSSRAWRTAYGIDAEMLEYGYPRNDILANATPTDVRRARDELGIGDRLAVLYAPTHREYNPGFRPTADVARFAERLGERAVLMARPHYAYGDDPELSDLHQRGRLLDVADHPSIEQLYLAADVLVTDYSSVMFDYGVLDRPIIVHAPDWDEYRTRRGTYFDIVAEPPGIVTRTDEELFAAFDDEAYRSPAASAARAKFRSEFCSWDDGRAAERVVRRVWLGEKPALPGTGGTF